MASASDIRAGGAFVELYLKGGHVVEQSLDKIANKTRAFATALSTVATISNITYGHSATAIRTSLTTVAGVIDKTSKAIQTSVRETAKVVTGTLDAIPKAVAKAGKALESLGTKTLFSGLVAGGAGAQTMATFMEYERQMQRVRALTGATGQLFADVTAKVRDLGRTTQYTTAQVAEGMAYLAMAGLKARDAIDVLPTVLNLATAAQMDLGLTADIVTDIGLAFGYTGKETKKVADVLAQAATNSNTTVEMMGMSFKYLASFAVAAGQSIEDMAAALALLAQVGIKKNTAGTGLREALINMVTPAKRKKLTDVLGVNIANARGEMRPLFDIVEDLRRSLGRFNQTKQLELMSQIFGKRGGNVMLALINQTTDALQRMRATIYDYDGAVDRMAGTMRDSLWGSWKAFVSVIQDVQIEIGTALVPAVRGLLDYFTSGIRTFSEFLAKNHELVIGISLAVPALIAAGAATLVFGKALTAVATIITPVVAAVSAGINGIAIAMIGATSLTGLFSTALMVAASAVQSLAAVAQSTVGMISMLSIATAGMIASTVMIAKLIPTVINGAIRGISRFIALGMVAVKTATNVSAAAAEAGAEAAKTAATVAFSFTAAVAKCAASIGVLIAQIALYAAAVYIAFTAMYAFIKAVILGLIEAAAKLAVAFWNSAKSITSALGTALLGTLKAIGKAFVDLGSAIGDCFERNKVALANWLKSLQSAFGQMYETYQYIVMALKSGDVELAMQLITLEAFRQLENMEWFARKLLAHLLEEVPKIVAKLGDILKAMFEGIGQSFVDLWTHLKQEFRIMMAEVNATIYEFLHKLVQSNPLLVAAVGGLDAVANSSVSAKRAREGVATTKETIERERKQALVKKYEPDRLADFETGQKLTKQFAAETNPIYGTFQNTILDKIVRNLPDKDRQLIDRVNGHLLAGKTLTEIKEERDILAAKKVNPEKLKILDKVIAEADKQIAAMQKNHARLKKDNEQALDFYNDVMSGKWQPPEQPGLLDPVAKAMQALLDILDAFAKGEVKGLPAGMMFEFAKRTGMKIPDDIKNVEKEITEIKKNIDQRKKEGKQIDDLTDKLKELEEAFAELVRKFVDAKMPELQGKAKESYKENEVLRKKTEGKSERQIEAEKEKAKIEAQLQRYREIGLTGKPVDALLEQLKAQNKIIAEEKRGMMGMTEHGQPSIPAAERYYKQLAGLKKLEAEWTVSYDEREDLLLAITRKGRLGELAEKNEKGTLTDEDRKMFNHLRTVDYLLEGGAKIDYKNSEIGKYKLLKEGRISVKGAEEMVKEENRYYAIEQKQKEIAELREKRAEPQRELDERRKNGGRKLDETEIQARQKLKDSINDTIRAERKVQKELDKLVEPEKNRQRRGISNDMMNNIFNTTYGMGTFSAYDIMRGGGSSNPMLKELRTHTNLLEGILETNNAMGE